VEALAILVVALPLLAAALAAAVRELLPPRVAHALPVAVAAAVTGMCVALLVASADAPVQVWLGGWTPRHGLAIGIVLSVEPLGASAAALAAALTLVALVVSWRYFDGAPALFGILMMGLLAGMVGFALSGDLFNMFTFLELMDVCAFGLTAYRTDQPGPLQGALNFAVTNTVGAILILVGITLLYGRTGALNLHQIGEALASRPPDGLVTTAWACLLVGFLVKAGAVPFHFWLADAYSVAPAPVCIVLSGIVSDLGLHGVAVTYWDALSGGLAAHQDLVRGVLVAVGVLTALVGGVMAVLQADLKRMLAYVTIGEIGAVLAGIGVLTAGGLAGASVSLVADGLLRGALFVVAGILLSRLGASDELRLRGRGRRMPVVGVIMAVCALGLAGPPPLGPFLGRALVSEGASAAGMGWVGPALALASALAAAALLRATARIFLGWGADDDDLLSREGQDQEQDEPEGRGLGRVSAVCATLLAVVALALPVAPALAGRAEQAAARLQDRPARAAELLHGAPVPAPGPPPAWSPTASALAEGAASTAGALVLGLLLLRPRRRRRRRRAIEGLRTVHSATVGDQVTWIVVGTAALAGVLALAAR
jgi:multicomponent Na+:H+ antiporter subunit D